jgi:hypothetical protein
MERLTESVIRPLTRSHPVVHQLNPEHPPPVFPSEAPGAHAGAWLRRRRDKGRPGLDRFEGVAGRRAGAHEPAHRSNVVAILKQGICINKRASSPRQVEACQGFAASLAGKSVGFLGTTDS